MQIETGTVNMLMTGFFFVIVLGAGLLLKLWMRNKDKGLIWFGIQLVFLILVFYNFIGLLKDGAKVPQAMLSEENSLSLGYIGLLWALSMVCMFLGLWKTNIKGKSNREYIEKQ